MRRLICGLDGLRRAWTTLQLREQTVGNWGKAAFASAKVACYDGMLKDARSHFNTRKILLGRFTKEAIVSLCSSLKYIVSHLLQDR